MMPTKVERGPRLTPAEIEKAKEIWAAYQKIHDITPWLNQMAAIDPKTGKVWIGETWREVSRQRDEEGAINPTYAVTVGKDYLFRKGGSR